MEPPILFTVEDGIATVVLNRRQARNSLNVEMLDALDRAWREVRDNPEIRVAVLTGAGARDFCTGIDVQLAGTPEHERFRGWTRDVPEGLGLRTSPWLKDFNLWKPLIAAVNGNCVATGVGLLTAADIRVAAGHASFAAPEARLGLLAQSGAVTRLPRQVPYCHAMMLLFTGQRISADEALRIGLVNEVAATGELMARAYEIARSIRDRDPHGVQITKQATMRGLDVGLGAALVEEALYHEMLEARRGPPFSPLRGRKTRLP